MMKYIKSFSQGQITIPKDFRDELGLGTEFWMKLKLINQKIVIEPVEKKTSKKDYADLLLEVDGSWFDMDDYKKMRREMRKRKNIYDW
ncbi:MAG: AbrB/MazE/SpoVT family DNA-binding domain-containing protein [Patescibacteria group bacterium]|nr:AbrB/MazE/SpoVT family DNA-binding domain-containing protein [Patescibacteria group bacterium]